MSDRNPQIQETQKALYRITAPPQTIPKYIIFKLQQIKDKEHILKEAIVKNTLPIAEQSNNYIQPLLLSNQ